MLFGNRQKTQIIKLEEQLEAECRVSKNQDKAIAMLIGTRDALLGNIRDLRIEASGLRKEKEALASELAKERTKTAELQRRLDGVGGPQ